MTDAHGPAHDHQNRHGHGHQNGHGHGHQDGHGHGHGNAVDFSGAADLLDLDAEVFAEYLARLVDLAAAAVAAAAEAAAPPDRPLRVADVGCGSGTGTVALLDRLPQAHVTAVDIADPLLARVRERAAARGTGDRLTTLAADLDTGWPDALARLDLVWAVTSLHHVADPPARLADVRRALAPGGALVLVELDGEAPFQPAFLADGDGLEDRLWQVAGRRLREALPFVGADWGALLAAAGFVVEEDLVLDVAPSPAPSATAPLARLTMQRLADLFDVGGAGAPGHVADEVAPADLDALRALAGSGPGSVLHRTLAPRARRHVWVARPAG